MKPQTREMIVGFFLLLIGAAVALGHYFAHEPHVPGKWEIALAGGTIFLGAWLVSPDAVTQRLKQVRDAVPFLEGTDDE